MSDVASGGVHAETPEAAAMEAAQLDRFAESLERNEDARGAVASMDTVSIHISSWDVEPGNVVRRTTDDYVRSYTMLIHRVRLLLLLVALVGAAVAPTAAAAQLHANVVSWSPNDVRVGEPVSVVLQLSTAEGSPYPEDGRPVAGVEDVEVVIRGGGPTQSFPTEDIGGGHYRSEIVFPNSGGWDLFVQYAAGSYGPADEIQLGKGGICVGAPICDAGPLQPNEDAAVHYDGGWTSAAPTVVVAGVLAAALAASTFWSLMRVRRRQRTVFDETRARRTLGVSRRRRDQSADAAAARMGFDRQTPATRPGAREEPAQALAGALDVRPRRRCRADQQRRRARPSRRRDLPQALPRQPLPGRRTHDRATSLGRSDCRLQRRSLYLPQRRAHRQSTRRPRPRAHLTAESTLA